MQSIKKRNYTHRMEQRKVLTEFGWGESSKVSRANAPTPLIGFDRIVRRHSKLQSEWITLERKGTNTDVVVFGRMGSGPLGCAAVVDPTPTQTHRLVTLFPEISFRPGSPRPFLAHSGKSARLRLRPPIRLPKSRFTEDLLHFSGPPHAGRLLTSSQTAGATSKHPDSESVCCISPFHVYHAHHGKSVGTTSSSHGSFLRAATWVSSCSALKLASQSRRWEITLKREKNL